MASPNNKQLIAVIKMPTKVGDIIVRLQQLQNKLTNNTYFPPGWLAGALTLAQFGIDVNAYISAETSVKNHVSGAVGLRNAVYLTIKADLQLILSMVQSKANANLPLAEAIIGSVGFFVRTNTVRQKKQNAAFNTQIVGTVLLTADGTGHHEWQMSKDMIAITNLPATTTCETHVNGLSTGDVWYFRNRKVNSKKTTYNWCSWIQLKVGAGGKNLGGSSSHNISGNMATA